MCLCVFYETNLAIEKLVKVNDSLTVAFVPTPSHSHSPRRYRYGPLLKSKFTKSTFPTNQHYDS